eukprot:scaffold5664_cov115-Isochrysis_galbana.AAC.14
MKYEGVCGLQICKPFAVYARARARACAHTHTFIHYKITGGANLARARAQSRLDAIEVAALEAQEALRMKSRHERRKKEQREPGYRG